MSPGRAALPVYQSSLQGTAQSAELPCTYLVDLNHEPADAERRLKSARVLHAGNVMV